MIRRSALNLNFQAGIARGDESVTTTSLLRRVRIAVTEAEKQEIGVLSWNEVKDPGAQPKTFWKDRFHGIYGTDQSGFPGIKSVRPLSVY